MKKIFFVITVFLFISSVLIAGEISRKDAALAALNFYEQQISLTDNAIPAEFLITSSYTEKSEGNNAFYAFNINDNGFVIISATDQVTPVIAYSFESVYSIIEQPVQFVEWMDNCKAQINYHRNAKTSATAKIIADWDKLIVLNPPLPESGNGSKGVTPLLSSTWNQGVFYNELCPDDPAGPGGHVYAGCVATAMGQIMYYYRYPLQGTGSHTYTHPPYGSMTANFGNTFYRWDEMTDNVSKSNLAVAELLYHCGIGVEMMYSPSGSGAYSTDAVYAYKNYFNYASNVQLVHKTNYSNANWNILLQSNIDAGMPMYYHGFGSGGHAFNLDGYQGNDYFHFNWGWGGSLNGYFHLDNLNPGGSDFTNGQGAIVNIYPGGTYPYGCSGMKTLTSTFGSFEDGSGPVASYENNITCSWLIDPQQGNIDSVADITLFFSKFETEDAFDLVTIYDGGTTSDQVLGTFSGTDFPSGITSSGNKMLIVFTTNNSINMDGFVANYSVSLPKYCDKDIDPHTASTGTISDGSGSKDYSNGSVCQWIIQPDDAEALLLDFNSFDTESIYDFIEVYEYYPSTQNGTLLGKFSGSNLPPTLVSHSGAMFIIFYTNHTISGNGWEATYAVSAVGIEEEEEGIEQIEIYPNPASDKLTIGNIPSSGEPLNIQLLNVNGELLEARQLEARQSDITIDINLLSPGMYFILMENNASFIMKKFIKE